jgi:hypothetical protein
MADIVYVIDGDVYVAASESRRYVKAPNGTLGVPSFDTAHDETDAEYPFDRVGGPFLSER